MAVSVVQRNKAGNAAASNTIALAFTGNTAAGNALIAIATTDGAASTLSAISDTQGKTWNLVSTIAGGFAFKCWIAFSSNAAADTITVTTGFNDSNLFIFEVAGLAASGAFDKSAFADQSSATALDSTNTATTSFANELLIGITANTKSPGLAPTLGTNYSNLQTLTTAFNGGGSEERIVSATGTYNATFGLAANNQSETTAIFTFSDTAVGGSSVSPSSSASASLSPSSSASPSVSPSASASLSQSPSSSSSASLSPSSSASASLSPSASVSLSLSPSSSISASLSPSSSVSPSASASQSLSPSSSSSASLSPSSSVSASVSPSASVSASLSPSSSASSSASPSSSVSASPSSGFTPSAFNVTAIKQATSITITQAKEIDLVIIE